MTQLCLTLLGLSVGVNSVNSRQFVPFFGREQRSLINTFPFSLNNHQSGLRDRTDDRDVGLDLRASRQGANSNSVSFPEVAANYAGGKRCIDKVLMEEVTEWDTEYTCEHSYNRRCAKSLATIFTAQQEEECEENYVKKCFIEYAKFATNVTVTVCRTPLIKDCNIPGVEVCSTQYESECTTEQEVHQVIDDVPQCRTVLEEKCEDDTSGYTTSTRCSVWPREECSLSKEPTTKYTPVTKCIKVPIQLCGPSGCGFVEGEDECYDKTQTVVGDKPEETCSLDPQVTCKHVTKLVPKLKEVENCFDVPKEICVRSQVNPRKVKKPVIKKWCYVLKCSDECRAAAAEGKCLPECEEYRGDNKCCPVCSQTCQTAARNYQCPSECTQYKDTPSCCGECPKRCQDAAKRGDSDSSCKKYEGQTGLDGSPCYVDYECPKRCQDAVKRGDSDLSCKKFEGQKGLDGTPCYVGPPEDVFICKSGGRENKHCFEAAQNQMCPNDCYEKFGPQGSDDTSCCYECPDLCRDIAKQEKRTYKNGTLDCGSFYDESCYFKCPDKCTRAYNSGESLGSCKMYSHLPKCYLPCPTVCTTAYNNGESLKDPCEKFKNVDRCYRPPPPPSCPPKCSTAYRQRECLPECKVYEDQFEQCYYECPTTTTTTTSRPTPPGPTPPTVKCPAKCTDKLRDSCDSVAGVPECDGIIGCCPEKFDVVFGAGVYLPPPDTGDN